MVRKMLSATPELALGGFADFLGLRGFTLFDRPDDVGLCAHGVESDRWRYIWEGMSRGSWVYVTHRPTPRAEKHIRCDPCHFVYRFHHQHHTSPRALAFKMSSLIVTVVIIIVVVIVIGAVVLSCALGWNRIVSTLTPKKWQKKSSINEKQHNWPPAYYNPHPKDSSDWVGSPISSPTMSPVASPRSSRYSSDPMMINHGASARELL
ncbi:hypothetical protein BJ170DRAFT_358003 [Xylariales sp. AK1849]|nr:hypothetical protein BJ170DRAFT_358003 [Xylariales sp. AK1849]